MHSLPVAKAWRLALFLVVICVLISAAERDPGKSIAGARPAEETIEIDASAPAHPFAHFWEKAFGSGRAILSLRESYRNDLRAVRDATGFEYVRFHAIFHDETGIYDEDANGAPVFNFSYSDQIYDGLLANKVRPLVELSFMPKKLSSDPGALHAFWYKQNVAPPKDWGKWDQLIQAFARHLIQRYGEDEVAQWYFEVWNEPNIDFWVGVPKQATYFELYDHTARALKAVSPRLRVGGPATAAADWVDAFLAHTEKEKVPCRTCFTRKKIFPWTSAFAGPCRGCTRKSPRPAGRICRCSGRSGTFLHSVDCMRGTRSTWGLRSPTISGNAMAWRT
jgi:hypothetical protein